MKIAFSTSGADLSAPLDTRFGRAPKFLVFDTESESITIVDNTQNLNAAQGAGVQSAQNVVASGAEVLVSGHCGPKAFAVLEVAGIEVYTSDAVTVGDALKAYQDGTLKALTSANVGGHWV